MSESLERRYQLALDWYPRAWRETHAEAMLGTLLDEAEAAGRVKPRFSDLANLRMFGLQARLTRLPHVVPAHVRDRVAAISFGTGFAISLIMFLGAEWAPWAPNGPWNGWARDWELYNVPVPGFGPFASAGVIFYALWMAAFGLAFLGLARTASFTLFATFPTSLMLIELSADRMVHMRPTNEGLLLMALLALLAMAGRPTRPGQKMRGAKWLAASAGLAVVVPGLIAGHLIISSGVNSAGSFAGRLDARSIWYELSHPWLYLSVFAVLITLALATQHRTWAIALSLSSVVWVGLALSWTAGVAGPTAILAAVVAVGLVLGALAVVRARGYRLVLQRR